MRPEQKDTMQTEPNNFSGLPPLERAAALRMLLADRLAGDLASFVKKAWTIIHPSRPLIWSWHYDLLCECLTAVHRRKIKRLIINVPPRTAKSTIATICFPCWVWASDPSQNFLSASYSLDLSTERSVVRRSLLQSGWYRRMWGDRFSLSGDRNRVAQFMNDRRGQMIATSIVRTSQGRGGDVASVAPPVSPDQARSDAERSTGNNWTVNPLQSRLNEPPMGAIVLI